MKIIGEMSLKLFVILVFSILLTACGTAESKSKEIKIGYQKGATMLSLKDNKDFEKELQEKGYTITWSEFNTGSSILEALNAGSIDFSNAGDMPTLFALAKGSDFKLIASNPDSPATEGIVVGKDTDIESLEDLKGKKVAYNNASIAQYLIVKALETVDLTIDDIESVHLAPSDASIAFEKGDVDAWVVWDPYMTVAENSGNIILQTAEGIVPLRGFHLSSTEMTENYQEVIETYVKYVSQIEEKIDHDPTEAAELMEEVTKVPADIWKIALKRSNYDVQYMDDNALIDLETQAQDLLDIGLIDNAIDFEDKIWRPESQ